VKLKWLIDNIPEIKQSIQNKSCLFGTVDTWLIWNLTGRKVFITDVTNASRTMLMNLKTLQWDESICNFFNIPMEILPEIRSSSEIYGYMEDGPLKGIPLSGVNILYKNFILFKLVFRRSTSSFSWTNMFSNGTSQKYLWDWLFYVI
jgi:glycerol kinase